MIEALPGLGLVLALAAAARVLATILPGFVSEVTVGIVLGIMVANSARLPVSFGPGARFAVDRLLRLGIVLLGARLFLGDLLSTGLGALAVILIGMAMVLLLALGAGRLFGMPPRLALLIGVGTAVCGNSAILATAPVIEAEERDVSFAVAVISLFGILAVLVYPLVGYVLGMNDRFFGHWAGLAINDTSQVTAASFAYSDVAGETATIVKLTRNTLMGPLIVLIGAWYVRSDLARAGAGVGPRRWGVLGALPLFVIGFVVLALLNSGGVIPAGLQVPISELSRALILAALVGVGLSTDLRALRQVGPMPLVVGLGLAVLLAGISLGLIPVLIRP